MRIGIVCYPTFGGSGVLATELGKALAVKGHEVHFISYNQPARLDFFSENIFTMKSISPNIRCLNTHPTKQLWLEKWWISFKVLT